MNRHLLTELLRDDAKPVFLTGAGISLASGIPTFRGTDPDAVWENSVLEMGTRDFFLRHPDKSWAWYLDRFGKCSKAEPNAAHHALVEIERKVPGTRVVTQNVDGLHHRAGQKNLIEVHGAVRKMRCTRKYCFNGGPRGFLDWDDVLFDGLRFEVSRKNLPRCPHCNHLLRAHVLWFDETYSSHKDYKIEEALDWFQDMTVLVCVGTSFSVGITSMARDAALGGVTVFAVDPGDQVPHGVVHCKAKAEEFLPELARAL